jgi:serine/threonine-protein kinase
VIGVVLRIRYELLQELGADPIFVTYRARDRVAGRDVRIRVLQQPFASEPAFVEALRTMLARYGEVQHEGLERLLALDDHEGAPFLVGELPSGVPAADRIKRLAPFSAQVSLAVTVKLCEALAALHARCLTHGDVCARNLVVSQDGRPTLALAGLWETYAHSRTAGSVVLPQMAGHLAPEVSEGAMPSPSSDAYAVGVFLFEMLAGRAPYGGDTPISIALKHAQAPVPSIKAFNPAVPAALEELVRKALAKSSADRYQGAQDMLADLRMISDALRFGKPIAWQVRREPEAGAALSAAPVTDPAENPVAPRMGAIRAEPKRARRQHDEEDEGVPRWLVGLVYAGALTVLLLIGGFVYWNLTKPKTLTVPNVVGMSVNEASTVLRDQGLIMDIARRVASDQFGEGTVMESSPRARQEAKQGSRVTVVVSLGRRFLETPDVRGMSATEARALLRAAGLDLDEPVAEAPSRDVPRGQIMSQTPAARTRVARGTRVSAVVSSGRERGERRPAVVTTSTYEVSIRMPRGEVAVLVRVDMTDARGTRTVHEGTHLPGESFKVTAEGEGDRATFSIFFDGDLVKQVEQQATMLEGTP